LPEQASQLTSRLGRRSLLGWGLGCALTGAASRFAPALSDAPRRWRIGFANITEDPAERLEGLGFTGAEVRASFVYAARGLPVELIFFDNDRNRDKALANAAEAVRQKLDLFVEYCADETANNEIGKQLKAAGIPIIAVNHAVPGATLYTADNSLAGHIAGDALAKFALANWAGERIVAVILGDLANKAIHADERADGVAAALKEGLPRIEQTRLDSFGNPGKAEGLLRRFAGDRSGTKLLVAALDDATALSAKAAAEAASRVSDTVIVSQGCDRSMHGGMNDKKEIDPQNRGSITLGSVAFFLDRYGYDVLPLALGVLGGEAPTKVTTRHVLVSATNVFRIYPPIDMN
jgi:ABC-type sugar transport system substrate-binding protein